MSLLPEKHEGAWACAEGTVQLPGRSVLEALTDEALCEMVAGEMAASAAQSIRTGWVLMEAKRRAKASGTPWEQWLTANGWQQSRRWADHCIKTTSDYLAALNVDPEVTSYGAIEVTLYSAAQASKVLAGPAKKPAPKSPTTSAPASPSDRVRGESQGTVDGPASSEAGAEGASQSVAAAPQQVTAPQCEGRPAGGGPASDPARAALAEQIRANVGARPAAPPPPPPPSMAQRRAELSECPPSATQRRLAESLCHLQSHIRGALGEFGLVLTQKLCQGVSEEAVSRPDALDVQGLCDGVEQALKSVRDGVLAAANALEPSRKAFRARGWIA